MVDEQSNQTQTEKPAAPDDFVSRVEFNSVRDRLEQHIAATENSVKRFFDDISKAGLSKETLERFQAHLDKYGDPAPAAKPMTPAS